MLVVRKKTSLIHSCNYLITDSLTSRKHELYHEMTFANDLSYPITSAEKGDLATRKLRTANSAAFREFRRNDS